jgi:hypothetical protein
MACYGDSFGFYFFTNLTQIVHILVCVCIYVYICVYENYYVAVDYLLTYVSFEVKLWWMDCIECLTTKQH